ncbi:hypothetical protein Fmac_011185 [Flemingia macrophylla]|uniref:Uncharacterized protein n=1 Tax=Flemingia macrophylla TaxID=520843 RepID=A0ABD1MLT7_9FABA
MPPSFLYEYNEEAPSSTAISLSSSSSSLASLAPATYGHQSRKGLGPPKRIGRAIEGNPVDIDLGKGGQGNAISRLMVRGMPLIFEINQSCVKQYLDHNSDNSQTFRLHTDDTKKTFTSLRHMAAE